MKRKIYENKYGKIPTGTLVEFEVENQSIYFGDLQGILKWNGRRFVIETESTGIKEIDQYLGVYGNTIKRIKHL